MEPIWSDGWFWAAAAFTLAALAAVFQVTKGHQADAYEDRLERIAEQERRTRPPKANLAGPRHWPQICPQDIAPGRNVVGRVGELAQIRRELEARHTAVIVPGADIEGQGGMGKTTLAREFVRTFRTTYFGVWWLPAQNPESLTTSLCELAAALGVTADPKAGPNGLARAVLGHVQQDRNPWLLIFDNAAGPRTLLGWLPEARHIHIIVTTRASGWPEDTFKLLQVGQLESTTRDSPASALLMQEARRTADLAGARALAETLDGLPLALVNAGAYLRGRPDTSYSNYGEELKRAVSQAPAEGGDLPNTVFGVASLSLDQLSPESAQIAGVLAFWAPERLDPGLFRPASAASEGDEFFQPIPADLWPVLRADGAVAQAFAELARRSILERRGEGNATYYGMHRLTGAVIRTRLAAEGRAQWREAAATVLAAAFPGQVAGNREVWPLCASLSPHVEALARHGAASAAAHFLYNQASIFRGEVGQDVPALLLARAALQVKKRHVDPLHRDLGTGYTTLALRWRELGRPVIAEKLLARAAAIAEENLETDAERRAIWFSNHGSALVDLGRRAQTDGKSDRAAALFKQAARRHQQALVLARRGDDRRAVSSHLNNLGALRIAQGRRAAAIRLARIAVKGHHGVLAPDDPSVAIGLHNLATRLLAAPGWREAEPLLDAALDIREGAYAADPRHPNRVNTANFAAQAALMRGDRAKAEAIVARYPGDLDLGRLQRDALLRHLRITADSGKFNPKTLSETLDLMGLAPGTTLPNLSQSPDPT